MADSGAKVITVINLKGGVGKTHTAWLLTGVCAERGTKLLAIDCDTQANLSRSLLDDRDSEPGLEVLFHPAADTDPTKLIRPSRFSNVDILPARPSLARFDVADQATWEKSDLHLSFVDLVAELRGQYEYLVFDCPPRLSLVSFAALCASDYVVIPLEAADWGAQGIVQVTSAVEFVVQNYNPRLKLLGYLVSRFRRARAVQQTYRVKLREHFGTLAFDTVIPDLARFEQSVTHGVPSPSTRPPALKPTSLGNSSRKSNSVSATLANGPCGSRADVQFASGIAA
jgi:chromosome partitioning protein